MYGIQLVSKSIGHMMMDTIMQHDYAISEFSQMSVLHFGTKILNNLAVTVCSDCVVI